MAEQEKLNEKKQNSALKQKAVASAAPFSAPTTPAAPTASPVLAAPSPTPAAPPPTPSAPTEEKKPADDKKQGAKKPVVKKEEAIARGSSLPISKKHAMYLCSFIKNKRVDAALDDLAAVLKFKKAVPFKGEIPHRHGMMSGRYPINAAKAFISILKGLRGNIAVAGLDAEKARIISASASWASRQRKSGGMRFKRTHVVLKAKEVVLPEKKTMKETAKENVKNAEAHP